MNIKQTNVKKLTITGVDHMDPINIFLESYNSTGQGKVTIEVWGDAWSYFWGSIGDRGIEEFFIKCDNGYLTSKFAPQLKSELPSTDEDLLREHAQNHIIKRRKEDEISKEYARELWNLTPYMDYSEESKLFEIYGDEYWYDLPQEKNPKFGYLCRVLDVAKEGVRQHLIIENGTGLEEALEVIEHCFD